METATSILGQGIRWRWR